MATKRKSLAETYIISEEESGNVNNTTKSTTEEPTTTISQSSDTQNASQSEVVSNVVQETKPEPPEIVTMPTEQVQTKTITVIQNNQTIEVPERKYNALEQSYLEKLDAIKHRIDNPAQIDRMNKRRKYSADRRRNVTFSIREDLAFLIDDLVDDAKIFKGLFSDELIILGMREYIKKCGLKQ